MYPNLTSADQTPWLLALPVAMPLGTFAELNDENHDIADSTDPGFIPVDRN